MQITKLCTKCGLDKPIEQFDHQKGTKDGYKYYCKACCKIIAKEHYLASKPKVIKAVRKWQWKNRRKVKGYKKAYNDRVKNKLAENLQQATPQAVPQNNLENPPQSQ